MSDALDAIEDIVEAINDYGSSITLNIITKGVYDYDTGDTADTNAPVAMEALIKSYKSKELENTDIHVDDIKFIIYLDGPVEYKDNITFNGQVYKLLNIDPKYLQDENLMYTIQGRR